MADRAILRLVTATLFRGQEEATKLRRRGLTLQAIADKFNAAGHRTARGCLYHPKAIMVMVNRVDPTANPEGGHPGNALVAAA